MTETKHKMPDGKELVIREHGTFTSELFIQYQTKLIKIGILNKNTGELVIFRKRVLHEHHRTNSYGFNAWLLHNSKHIKNIRIYEDNDGVNNEYLISKQAIIDGGKEMNFINEVQIFYPIKQLETFHKI